MTQCWLSKHIALDQQVGLVRAAAAGVLNARLGSLLAEPLLQMPANCFVGCLTCKMPRLSMQYNAQRTHTIQGRSSAEECDKTV